MIVGGNTLETEAGIPVSIEMVWYDSEISSRPFRDVKVGGGWSGWGCIRKTIATDARLEGSGMYGAV